MPTFESIDPEALAAEARAISRTAQNDEGTVTVTARPRGELDEITVDPSLQDLGHEAAAAEILAVIKAARGLADAEFQQQVQRRVADLMRRNGGEAA